MTILVQASKDKQTYDKLQRSDAQPKAKQTHLNFFSVTTSTSRKSPVVSEIWTVQWTGLYIHFTKAPRPNATAAKRKNGC